MRLAGIFKGPSLGDESAALVQDTAPTQPAAPPPVVVSASSGGGIGMFLLVAAIIGGLVFFAGPKKPYVANAKRQSRKRRAKRSTSPRYYNWEGERISKTQARDYLETGYHVFRGERELDRVEDLR